MNLNFIIYLKYFIKNLSANKEASFFVESVYDGIDLRSHLTR